MTQALFKLLLRILSLLPLSWVHRLGGGLGALIYWHGRNPLVRVSRINLERCFPELDPERRETLLKNSLRETARAFLELGALWRWPCARLEQKIQAVEGEELIEHYLSRGRGLIILTPHLGAWELTGLRVALRYPLTGLYRPLRRPSLETPVRRARERCGGKLLPANRRGLRALYQTLERNEIVGILPDQTPREAGAGVFAPFFGQPAHTMTLVARLAHKTGAPVIFIHAERLPRGRGFRLHYWPAPPGIASPNLEQATGALNRGLEQGIRRHPEQYLWSYKRFKQRPPGQPALY